MSQPQFPPLASGKSTLPRETYHEQEVLYLALCLGHGEPAIIAATEQTKKKSSRRERSQTGAPASLPSPSPDPSWDINCSPAWLTLILSFPLKTKLAMSNKVQSPLPVTSHYHSLHNLLESLESEFCSPGPQTPLCIPAQAGSTVHAYWICLS